MVTDTSKSLRFQKTQMFSQMIDQKEHKNNRYKFEPATWCYKHHSTRQFPFAWQEALGLNPSIHPALIHLQYLFSCSPIQSTHTCIITTPPFRSFMHTSTLFTYNKSHQAGIACLYVYNKRFCAHALADV